MFKKTIYFRLWSNIMTLIAGRVWFGDCHCGDTARKALASSPLRLGELNEKD